MGFRDKNLSRDQKGRGFVVKHQKWPELWVVEGVETGYKYFRDTSKEVAEGEAVRLRDPMTQKMDDPHQEFSEREAQEETYWAGNNGYDY